VLSGARVRGDFVFTSHSTIVHFSLNDVDAGAAVCTHADKDTVLIPPGAPRQGTIDL
jgi:hypothetical protein